MSIKTSMDPSVSQPVRISELIGIPKSSDKKTVFQPVRISELIGIPKSSDKKTGSEKKRSEPVKVKDLLASCSKAAPSSKERSSKSTFTIPRNTKKTVRRALYGSLSTQKQTPNKNNNGELSTVKSLVKNSPRQLRKSLLPPRNSIAQQHVRQIINETRHSTIIEERYSEIHESPKEKYQRPTVIKNAISRLSQYNSGKTIMNKSTAIPSIIISEDDDIKEAVNQVDELEASVIDKENIPPALNEHKSRQLDELNLHLIGLYRGVITRLEKVESDCEMIKIQQTLQTDILNKIYNQLQLISPSLAVPNNPENTSSTSKILNELKLSSDNVEELNKENITSINKKKRQSRESNRHESRRRSARLAAKSPGEKYNDSFVELENELNINNKLTPTNSPIIETPKNNFEKRNGTGKSSRPLREYLAMKATMNCLETPEPNGFRCNIDLIHTDTPSHSKNLRRSISSKLFDELQDLYHDSPDAASSLK